jgi:hypothetical protein
MFVLHAGLMVFETMFAPGRTDSAGGGGGIGFRIVRFHRKNCPDFGSGECFTRISDLINIADCGFI